MAGLRGYSPIPGSARRYRAPDGSTISRRQYDNLRAQAAGFDNRYELEQFRRDEAGSPWFGDIYARTGRHPTFQDYADIREVQQRREALRARYGAGSHAELDSHDPELVAPDGPLARILDRSGKRPLSGRPVGAS